MLRKIIFTNFLIVSISTFSQTSSLINTQVDSIFKSRGYRLWQREKDGIIEFEKKITKKITIADILNSQKYYGCKCDKDTRLTLEEDLDREYKVVKKGIVSSETLNEIIPAEYDYVDNVFSDNKLLVKKDSNYFLFDRNGKELDKELIKDFVHIDFRCSQNYYEYDCEFRRVQNKNGKWGYINQNWKIVIPCIYDNLEWMRYYGHTVGTLNGNIGVVNNKGDFKQVNGQSIEPFPYYESLYTVYTSKNKKGVVDINANIVINPIYDDIRQQRNYFFIKLNGKWGVVDKFNSILIPINFFDIVQSSGESLKGISVKLHKDSSFISYEVLQERERLEEEKQAEARRVEEARRIAEENKKESRRQAINRDLKNEDCSVIVKEYEKFVNEFSKYCSSVKSGKTIPNISEYGNWENKLRFMQNIVFQCSNGVYSSRVLTAMTKLQSSAQIIFRSTPQSNNLNNTVSNSAKRKCTKCRPSDSKGWWITDYDYVKKQYLNGRYIKNIGHKPCSSCRGQGSYKRNDSSGEIITCGRCKGDRWEECDNCKGTGETK
jgi:hypothetical protein